MARQFASLTQIEPRFIDGFWGRVLSDTVCETLVKHPQWLANKGTIGCFLSHVSAWEAAAQVTEGAAVILEDDADISQLEQLFSIDLPDDLEILFINNRMAPFSAPSVPSVTTITTSLEKLNATRSGSGSDGYMLTPKAAQKLLKACKTDFYYGHVDGRLLRYATSEADMAAFAPDSWIVSVVRQHHHPTLVPQLGLLKGYSLTDPLVRHLGLKSSRELEDNFGA
jgi:GR25 family glycosyltransferase involved in LPS biosynthesis